MPTALITGASKGIGKAIAEEFAKKQIDLLLVARSADLLKETASHLSDKYGVEAKWLAADLAKLGAAQQIFSWCKENKEPVSILVNNAGYGLSGPFEKYTIAEHTEMMQVNMNVVVELTYLLLPMLHGRNKAYILNISSGAAYQAVPGLTIYAATKSFLLSFSRGLRYELRKSNISVTAVCPGATDTDFANRAKVTGAKAKKAAAQFNMQPAEVARLAVEAMFAEKAESTTGFVNKLAVFFAWLLPKSVLEKAAAGIYEI